MPVTTRRMSKNKPMPVAPTVYPNVLWSDHEWSKIEDKFRRELHILMNEFKKVPDDKQLRMEFITQIYGYVNPQFRNIFMRSPKRWHAFACAYCNKCTELMAEPFTGIDPDVMNEFVTEMDNSKYVVDLLRTFRQTNKPNMSVDDVKKFYDNLDKGIYDHETVRPRLKRNVPVVDYASVKVDVDMDDDDSDNDSDYVPEDDEVEDDEYDEDEYDDENEEEEVPVCKPKKVQNVQKKEDDPCENMMNVINEMVQTLEDKAGVKTFYKIKNYPTLDMYEDKAGNLHVRKQVKKKGSLEYKWTTYPPHEAKIVLKVLH